MSEDIQQLFKVYPCKNLELKMLSRMCYEFARHIAAEASAALTSGLDDHAVGRVTTFLERLKQKLDSVSASPIPDLPALHPLNLQIDLESKWDEFQDAKGNMVNEDAEMLCTYFLFLAVELARSNSANMSGGLTPPDYQRATNLVATIAKLLDDIRAAAPLDLPETSAQSALIRA